MTHESIPEHLLEAEQEETIETKKNLYRFYNYARTLLPNNDMNVMVAAAKTLGQIVEIGGAAFDDRFMDYHVPAAINLLQAERQELHRYAGVLTLKELAMHGSSCFQAHIPLVFEKLLLPLRDSKLYIREAAAGLLDACLMIITQRERNLETPFLFRILQDAQAGLKTNSPETIHGSLLTYRALLLHAGMVSKCNPFAVKIRLLMVQCPSS